VHAVEQAARLPSLRGFPPPTKHWRLLCVQHKDALLLWALMTVEDASVVTQ
jgi:hypothetical protein